MAVDWNDASCITAYKRMRLMRFDPSEPMRQTSCMSPDLNPLGTA